MVFELFFNQRKVKVTITLLFIFTLFIPLVTLLQSNIGVDDILRFQAPKGQVYYMASKLLGLTAFILLWWQMILGFIGKEYSYKRSHVVLGIFFLTIVLLHVILFFSAVSIRSEIYAFGVLMPDFTSGYYKSALSLGVVALLLLFVSIVFGFLRRKRSVIWQQGHKLVFLVFALVVAHSYKVGSEIQSGLFLYMLYFSVSSIFLVVTYRFVKLK